VIFYILLNALML